MRIDRLTILLCTLLWTTALAAQVVYQCDFESAQDRAAWQLNVGANAPKCANHWYLGEPGNFSEPGTGEYGLYVAPQTDTTHATYASAGDPMSVMAYTDINLPAGNYILDFDWRCQGSPNTGVVVAWVGPNNFKYIVSMDTRTYSTYIVPMGSKLSRMTSWTSQRMNFTVTAADTPGRLVFIWDQARYESNPPSGCIDNIVIREACNLNAPTGLTYDAQNAVFSWNGPRGATYEVRDYCVNDGTLVQYEDVQGTSLSINLVAEGTHNFSVRSVTDDCVSTWVSISNFTYIPGKRCIEYLDLGTRVANAGKCYTGLFEDFITNNRQGTLEMVDNGSSDPSTQHCIHTNLNETDPNTTINGGLKTVPAGEIASVRCGAYTSSGKSSRIEYQYTVPAGMSDLLVLKYAVVTQSGNHEENIQPRFILDVLDGQGHALGSSCVHKEFVPGFGETSNWHIEDDIYWCDWDSVTVSLRPYVGQTLTIRLTSTRCTYDTHWTKAYFTLACRDGGLEGLACGDFSTDHFEAPLGFTYRWYNETTKQAAQDSASRHGVLPYTTRNGQVLHIDSTSAEIYLLECHDPNDYSCYYTLTANPNPRYPKAKGDVSVFSRNCQNMVNFTNTSYVAVVNRKDSTVMSEEEKINTFLIDFGDGSPEVLVDKKDYAIHEYPASGGTFHARLTASMNEGVCTADTFFTIVLPDIVHTGDTTTSYHKVNTPYTSRFGHHFNSSRDTLFIDSILSVNMYGCDAPSYEYIYYFSRFADTLSLAICAGDSAYFPWTDRWYYQTCEDSLVIVHPDDSDTTHYFQLYVVPRLTVEIEPEMDICGRDAEVRIPLTVTQGSNQYAGAIARVDFVSTDGTPIPQEYTTDTDVLTIPLPNKDYFVQPDYYTIRLTVLTQPDPLAGDLLCGSDGLETELLVRYDSTVIDQKFEYVALLNAAYNYGQWTYDEIHWYQNDSELRDQVGHTFLHTSYLNHGDAYHVSLKRQGHNRLIPSCKIVYTGSRAVPLTPNAAAPARVMGTYDAMGVRTRMGANKGLYLIVYDNHEAKKVLVY